MDDTTKTVLWSLGAGVTGLAIGLICSATQGEKSKAIGDLGKVWETKATDQLERAGRIVLWDLPGLTDWVVGAAKQYEMYGGGPSSGPSGLGAGSADNPRSVDIALSELHSGIIHGPGEHLIDSVAQKVRDKEQPEIHLEMFFKELVKGLGKEGFLQNELRITVPEIYGILSDAMNHYIRFLTNPKFLDSLFADGKYVDYQSIKALNL